MYFCSSGVIFEGGILVCMRICPRGIFSSGFMSVDLTRNIPHHKESSDLGSYITLSAGNYPVGDMLTVYQTPII